MIHCPFCRHEMNLKGARPGKFSPKCPACGEKFGLVVPEDPEAPPTVVKLPPRSHHKSEVVEKVDPAIANALGIEITPPPVHAKRPARANVVAPKPAAAAPSPPRPAAAHAEARQASAAASVTIAPSPVAPPVSPGGSNIATMPPAEKLPEAAAALSPVNRDIPSAHAGDAPASIPASMPHAPAPAAGANEELNLSGRLGGYDIIQKLGRGGMGAVYLARQVSLDRNVAVKVLHPKFASDPQFVARFTREAYAAAHLVHHNVVQIHDIGAERDVHYYSMEFVEGQTLNQVVHKDGRLDPEVAVGHVLQAARGLKFAHEHGMIHRDIKPDNLMLNDQGIVKVADLGLVKTPAAVEESSSNGANGKHGGGAAHSTDLAATMVGVAMGTPAFMSPEQCADATKVDQRADIYSLGCTLYDLLTGRPPFSGKTAIEVMTKHQREDAVPPERVAKHVPERLSKIVMKMMAKRPEERYPTMNEVILDLEEFLGVNSTGPFTPKEEHVERLEASVKWFNDSSMAKLRPKLIAAFFALCVLAIAATAAMGRPLLAGGLVGFMLLTAASYVVVTGITQRTALFLKLRQLVFGARIVDWLKWIGIGAMAVAILFILDLLWIWAAFCVGAVGVAAAFHFTVDRLSAKQRQQPVHNVEMMLKQMRAKGLAEDALRQFVCKYAGERWEEFYETLFGYEAKLTARTHWGKSDRGRARKKFAAWRDPVIAWIDHRIQARKEAAERRHLQKIEAKAMRAKGVSEKQAAKAAARKAEKMVEQAAHLRETMDKRAAVTIGPSIANSAIATALKNVPAPAAALGSPPNVSLRSIIDDAEAAEDEGKVERQRGSYFSRRFGGPLDWLFGPQTRLLLAIVVLAGFMLWRYQNKQSLIEEIDVRGSRLDAVDTVALDPSKAIQTQRDVEYEGAKAQKLQMKGVPELASNLASSYNAGVAGAMLLLSTLFRGRILGLLVILAAALTLAGHLYELPAVGHLHRSITLLAGLGLTIFAWIFFRQK